MIGYRTFIFASLVEVSVAVALSIAALEKPDQDCIDVFADPGHRHGPCYVTMQRAMRAGFSDQEMYDFQQFLFEQSEDGCPRPCHTRPEPQENAGHHDHEEELSKAGVSSETTALVPEFHGLDFFGSHVEENNLGGAGPTWGPPTAPGTGPKHIKFKHVDDAKGMVDLVISNTTAYTPSKSVENGLTEDGYWAKVNLKCGTSTTLNFSFQNSQTGKPVTVKDFFFTIAGIDQGLGGRCRKTVQPDGYMDFALSSTTHVTQAEGVGGRFFMANYMHNVHKAPIDNPTSTQLTKEQEDRAIGFLYRDVHSFSVTITTEEGLGGRNFFFGGATSMTPAS